MQEERTRVTLLSRFLQTRNFLTNNKQMPPEVCCNFDYFTLTMWKKCVSLVLQCSLLSHSQWQQRGDCDRNFPHHISRLTISPKAFAESGVSKCMHCHSVSIHSPPKIKTVCMSVSINVFDFVGLLSRSVWPFTPWMYSHFSPIKTFTCITGFSCTNKIWKTQACRWVETVPELKPPQAVWAKGTSMRRTKRKFAAHGSLEERPCFNSGTISTRGIFLRTSYPGVHSCVLTYLRFDCTWNQRT